MVTVSVILPTFNRAHTLQRAIQSVLAQSHSALELIVIDDCSTDHTEELMKTFNDSRLVYVLQPDRRGPGAARNAGIAAATHDFIAFQDSDDEWKSTKLAQQVDAISSNETLDRLIYSDMERVNADGSTEYWRCPDVSGATIIDTERKDYAVSNIGIQSCLTSKSVLSDVGGFNEALPALEDLELFIRISQHYEFLKLAEPLVRYFEGPGVSSNLAALRQARRMILELHGARISKEAKWFVASEMIRLRGD